MPVNNQIIPDRPTLIIGLGGVGCKIVEGVWRQFDAHEPTKIERRNVAFLCLDTDETDVNNRKKVMPENSVIKTSSDVAATVGGYIESISSTTSVLDWFDTSSDLLLGMELNKGAAQVRMASRLALMASIGEGKLTAIDNSITNLLANEPERANGNLIRIYIVSSLAGGTGAGSFLQIAYYVRNAMEEHGIHSCYIDGFFVLSDVLCDSTDVRLNPDQIENTRSNTYACMKELVAFTSSDKNSGLRDIEFEYRLSQPDKRLPMHRPYDQCFLIDFRSSNGQNLSKSENYYRQVQWFVYLQAFSPAGGKVRQDAINNMRSEIRSDGRKMFAGLGVSKLIYPVDDLYAYFSRRRVSENMRTSWCKIDKDFEDEYKAYKQDKRDGVPHEEPKIGKFFMDNVKELSKNQGPQGAEFLEIYKSTQELDQDFVPTGVSKATTYFAEVNKTVLDRISTNADLSDLHSKCLDLDMNFLQADVEANDANTVRDTEDNLKEYWKRSLTLIDSVKRVVSKQCFIDDYELPGRVSKTPETAKHHLNTVILKKDEEMHPLAVRYFLYDLRELVVPYVDSKVKSNEALKNTIERYFKEAYDVKETTDVVETALDAMQLKKDANSGMGKKIVNFLSAQKPYREWKKEYKTKSSAQAAYIKKYAEEKLLEEVFTSLLGYINRVLEESENFFDRLPDALEKIENECNILLTKHDGANDRDVTYVLASEQNKKDIYDYEISKNDSPFFPTEMSAALYRTMYDNAVRDFARKKHASSRVLSEDEKKEAEIAANKRVVDDCVKFQEKTIRESTPQYAKKNVIAALQEEAMREMHDDPEKAKEYRERKFKNFRDQARFWGPSTLDATDRYINAWGFNPVCLEESGLTAKDLDELFGEEDISTNHQNAATRLPSKFFSPFEIVRANSVTLLSITDKFENFKQLESSEMSRKSFEGSYFKAYKDVIKRVYETENRGRSAVLKNEDDVIKEITVHLDKRWHLPAYMPNIGSTHMVEITKLFEALSYGLLFGQFKAVNHGGEYYWKHIGTTSKWIRDIDKNLIPVSTHLEFAINELFEKGLANNPGIVEEVLGVVKNKWKDAKTEWHKTEHNSSNELDKMKQLTLVKTIVDFKFKENMGNPFTSEDNWFHILKASKDTALYNKLEDYEGYLKDHLFEDVISRSIELFGHSANTKSLCEHIFDKVESEFKADYADRVLAKFVNDKSFQPKD